MNKIEVPEIQLLQIFYNGQYVNYASGNLDLL